jgi:hypothetical protein
MMFLEAFQRKNLPLEDDTLCSLGQNGQASRFPQNATKDSSMCRNIKILFNFKPPATDDEVRAAALQFVRKISGFNKPSQANEATFSAAVEEITLVSRRLLYSLETTAPPKNREEEAAKAKARSLARFGD